LIKKKKIKTKEVIIFIFIFFCQNKTQEGVGHVMNHIQRIKSNILPYLIYELQNFKFYNKNIRLEKNIT